MTSNYALRLPTSLKRELEKVAREDNTSLNQLLVIAAAEKLSALRTERFFAERAARANLKGAMEALSRGGNEPPRPGDEIPEGYISSFERMLKD